ncbi:helicase-related protein [Sphingomonas jaspsi]|uniref:helicase-related protein n=1 Tax=Sphingomonas jaspsi TaxID=392409 RepID=UPI0004BB481F|nr:helicase-related protein [Sphingomonas jaspsi]
MNDNNAKPTLRGYQVTDLGFHIANPKSLNLSDPGTGKTPTACVLFYYWWARKGWRTIWAMPKSLMEKNRDELLRFTDFAPEDVVILESDFEPLKKSWTGPTFWRTKTIRTPRVRILDHDLAIVGPPTTAHEIKTHRPDDDIVEVNDDGQMRPLGSKAPFAANDLPGIRVKVLAGPDGKPMFDEVKVEEEAADLIKSPKIKVAPRKYKHVDDPKVFICTFAFLRNNYERLLKVWPTIGGFGIDELHMGYSTPGSEQTTSFYHVANHCQGLLGMTGTLIDGRLDSAFPVIHAIEPRYYGGLPGFHHEHAAWINDFGKVETWKNEEKLKGILGRHAVRHDFEEVYGKEPVYFTPIEETTLDMFPEQQAAYDEFHEQAMLELEDGRILDGSLPGVAVIRATQIMAHPETMGLAKGEVTAKDRRLMEYAVEGRPLLVFSAAQAEQERCVVRLQECGLKVGLINANVSTAMRGAIDRDFRNGKLDAIVGSGPTVAVGYNWERADHVVGVSWDYKDVNFVQAYRRASRGSRTTILRVSSLVYRNSIDFRKLDILSSKSQLAARVDDTRKVLQFW